MARMNIKKAYKKNFMLAKVLYEDGFFASYHVSKHLKNLLRIRSILLSLGSECQQYGYLEASLYKKLEDLQHHTQKSLKQSTMSIKEWEAKVYELEAHVERLPLKTGNEQLFLYLQKLKSLTVDLNDKLLTYHRRYERVEADLLFIMEQVEKEDFVA